MRVYIYIYIYILFDFHILYSFFLFFYLFLSEAWRLVSSGLSFFFALGVVTCYSGEKITRGKNYAGKITREKVIL